MAIVRWSLGQVGPSNVSSPLTEEQDKEEKGSCLPLCETNKPYLQVTIRMANAWLLGLFP